MDRGQRRLGNRRLCERKQNNLIARSLRALRAGIEAAHRFHFVAKKLDAHRALRLGRIGIENAPTQGILPGHLDHIHRAVAHGVQVFDQPLGVNGLALADDPREIGVVFLLAQAHGRRGDGRNHHRRAAGHNFPQSAGTRLLNLRMRRKVLKRQDVIGRQRDHARCTGRAGQLAKGAQHRQELLGSPVIGD